VRRIPAFYWVCQRFPAFRFGIKPVSRQVELKIDATNTAAHKKAGVTAGFSITLS
jgi:hypothetical protein